MDHHIHYFIGKGLKLTSPIIVNGITPIDIRIPSMMKRYGNVYSFSNHFAYPNLIILIGKFLPHLSKDIMNEL